ncbi:putative 2',3'-cyclic-nucleotide 3'-phosphodiesterase [Heracleum sosnowskyi]|uniref:2',3'-cyclic-nucleotide 3'-phosphodiesterase n=1 Tax=Heracleum sosnowskyi TaxID=360622 RepID=A0AAD8GY01_9APIA|nr:putative 2',3'-cyclic-nucleotide 3'-phosphodiesterase [Heracleum sosnowskyi]
MSVSRVFSSLKLGICKPSPVFFHQRKAVPMEQSWRKKPQATKTSSTAATEDVSNRLRELSVAEDSGQSHASVSSVQFGTVGTLKHVPAQGVKSIWKPKSYGTVSGATSIEIEKPKADQDRIAKDGGGSITASAEKNDNAVSKFFNGKMLEDFTVDKSTYSRAQIRATFYPKFENEKSDQEVRTRMIELVSKGLGTLEVSLKHSGSLFMYAGHEGGAYAKNSYGNIYTAVGVFVLGRTFREAWGSYASKKQSEFNDYLEKNRMCLSMELVTAVLGDHGQRPLEDYVVVTAVTELGKGRPLFYSTPDVIAFCRKWRLPTNHVWLFSTRKSVTSFFAAYDALCEEGTATPVCQALDQVADISIPGSKDHVKVQGEILEGLVGRIVSHESSKYMEQVLRDSPPYELEGVDLDLGPSLREICAANRSDEKQQIRALLQNVGTSFCPNYVDWSGKEGTNIHSSNADRSILSKFLQSNPSDFSTTKFQEMIRLMKEKRFPAAFKCYYNFHKTELVSSDNLQFKMVIHVRSDSAFRRYQNEMRHNPGLWPLYRGFFVDLNLFKATKDKVSEFAKDCVDLTNNVNDSNKSGKGGLADEDANLMIKMKFLTYKLRTFLIRNGLSILFKEGPAAYKTYYMRQMKIWNTSAVKQKELSKMLDEWAVYIRRKHGHKQLSSSIYLTEVEPFLENYAKRSPQNQTLIGSAGNLVRAEDFMAIIDGGKDEEGNLETDKEVAPSSPSPSVVKDAVRKNEGLIVFFPGIPGCAKSALCKEILSSSVGLEDDRPVHSLMGDLVKGKYWQKIAEQRRKKPYSIMLADKNAPNEEVWRQIESMCRSTKASAVPVVPDSEGTETNPFSLDALAIFTFRVLNRVNHPGNLDKASPNACYVLLVFYHLYDGKNRREFEAELVERFGSLVKMPLLKPDRRPLPESIKSTLEEGINLYRLHSNRHGRLDSTKGTYAQEWTKWEKKIRDILFGNAEYLNSIQVPFESTVKQVLQQLRSIAKGDYKAPTTPPSTEKRKLGNIVFAAVNLPVMDIQSLLQNLGEKNSNVEAFFKDKNMSINLKKAHLTLAHKRSHGVIALANYGSVLHQNIPVEMTALFFSDEVAALEGHPGSSSDGEKVTSKNIWPHVTLWTAEGIAPKEANNLPQLFSEGKATRIEIDPPITITGAVEYY